MRVKTGNKYWFTKSILKKEIWLPKDVEEKVITIHYSKFRDIMNGWSPPLTWTYDHQ